MKTDKLNRIFDAMDEIEESKIASALPKSLQDAHLPAEDTVIEQEESSMKNNPIMHYITTGFAAAAAIAVVTGGVLLISSLNGKNTRKPGASVGSDTAQVTDTTPHATTTSAPAEQTTTQTEAPNTDLQASLPEISGDYGVNLNGWAYHVYQRDGSGVKEIVDKTGLISDGNYLYRTNDCTLYRCEDQKAILTIEDPEQYLERAKDAEEQIYCAFESITDAGSGWYFVVAEVGTYTEKYDEMPCPIISSQVCFWTNPVSGQKQHISTTAEPTVPGGIWLKPQYVQLDPDGGAVYAIERTETYVFRIEVPKTDAEGSIPAEQLPGAKYKIDYTVGQYDLSDYTPISGGRLLFKFADQSNGRFVMPLMLMNTADGSMTQLREECDLLEFYNINGRVICFSDGKLMEFDPDTNKTETIAETDSPMTMVAVWDNAVLLTYLYDYDPAEESHPNLLVSLTDGTVTELQ